MDAALFVMWPTAMEAIQNMLSMFENCNAMVTEVC